MVVGVLHSVDVFENAVHPYQLAAILADLAAADRFRLGR